MVEIGPVQELAHILPDGAPVVHLIRAPAALPPKEAAHLPAEESSATLPAGLNLEVWRLQRDACAVETHLKRPLCAWRR